MSQYNGSSLAICSASFLSEFLTHPFEVLKTKSQIKYSKTGLNPSQLQIYKKFVQKHGFGAIYRGFSAGLLRASLTQLIRLNVYEKINTYFPKPEGTTLWQQLPSKFGSALASSLVAGSATNIFAVLKVRMITDKTGEHGSLLKSFKTIINQDGFQELTKGTVINVVRGSVFSAVELAAYDTLKQILRKQFKHEQVCYFVSSVIASFLSAFLAYPWDVIITIYMNERSQGNPENRGIKRVVSIGKEMSKKGGLKGFYVGFSGYASRSMVYGPIFWNSLEFFNSLATKEQLQV